MRGGNCVSLVLGGLLISVVVRCPCGDISLSLSLYRSSVIFLSFSLS